jgi:hypothetical protein
LHLDRLPDGLLDGLAGRQYRFFRHVDDRLFVGPGDGVVVRDGGDPITGHPVGRRALAVLRPFAQRACGGLLIEALQCGAVLEVRVEQDLQAGPQRGQLVPQRGHLVGGLSA